MIPPLPKPLSYIDAAHNRLTSFPDLRDSMYEVHCSYNPDLKCFPRVTRLNYFIFDSIGFTCLPDRGNVTLSHPPVESLPICATGNPNGCTLSNSVGDIKILTFSLYPNPAGNEVMIALNKFNANTTLQVTDVAGKVLIQSKFSGENYLLRVEQLPAGFYVVSISNAPGDYGLTKLVKE